ncbi:DUF4238 domain-containing protein [Roseateles sp. NT4]|uniref:DUF4238 domain-containing protein n=1 Tax=Roseateles sp. NT4 TaxID=3453715 RepID=UPI003EEC43EB
MKRGKQTHSKHHFVPEFYLRAWATPDESQAERLTYFQWIPERLHAARISPKGAAKQVDLYAGVDKDGKKTQAVEQEYFGPKVDDPAAPVIAKMIAGGQPLSEAEAAAFARYVVAQRVRTPGYVKHVRAEATQAVSEMAAGLEADYQALRQEGWPPSLNDFIQHQMPHLPDFLGVQSLPRLIEQPSLLADILEFEWGWGHLDAGDQTLLTSDRPVVFTKGLSDPNCIVALPLSPRVAVFAMKDPQRLRRLLERPARDLVEGLNTNVVMQAKHFVYSRDELQRAFVERHFKRPEEQEAEAFRRLRP